jgi:hypothetical protein
MEQEKPITLLGFSGQEETSFGKYFAPLLNIRIEDHISQISRPIGPLETGFDIIIPGEWFMVKHPMSFKGNEIQMKSHICDPESIISYDEIVLDDDEVLWIGSLTTIKAPDSDKLKELVFEEYLKFKNLFGEPQAQKPSTYQTFDHQIQIKGKEASFGPIYHLSEKGLGALREYLDSMLAQEKIAKSDANIGVFIIFVPKPNGKFQLCVDYRKLNAVTIKDPYPLLLVYELRD